MTLIIALLIGFIIGAVAKFFMPGEDPGGCFTTAILGIVGSWMGSLVFGLLGFSTPVGFIGSVIGAMIVLWIYRMMRKR